jgi:hypothetical protein
MTSRFILPESEELMLLLSKSENPIVLLATLRRWLHTRYHGDISTWEIAALMMQCFSLGVRQTDDAFRVQVFCDDSTEERTKEAFIDIRSRTALSLYKDTDWNDLLQKIVHSYDADTG